MCRQVWYMNAYIQWMKLMFENKDFQLLELTTKKNEIDLSTCTSNFNIA
jgi:desulfoferrodoxin (superoxide reductase-like protein)